MTRLLFSCLLPLLVPIALTVPHAFASDANETCAQWEVHEHSHSNATYSGNPFDLIARVTFTHTESGATRATEMFYDGGDTWKWRFNGEKQGRWSYVTSSADADLDGHTGTIDVTPNPDPDARGFLTVEGNRYALMSGADGAGREGYLLNVFQDHRNFPFAFPSPGLSAPELVEYGRNFVRAARNDGAEVVYVSPQNAFFKLGARSYEDHNSTDPDPATFRVIENLLRGVRTEGGRIHFWAWGDERRKTTPIGVGEGINGKEDRRLQRYIAARLGPLPGWTMGYGFDNSEWVTKAQAQSWASFMHDRMGWPHVLSVREYRLDSSGPSADSYATIVYSAQRADPDMVTTENGPNSYSEILEDVRSSEVSPTFYEERYAYNRFGFDMAKTRRTLWRCAMAGGAAFWYGYFGSEASWMLPGNPSYSHPEQLRTHYRFWHVNNRFDLDYVVDNSITDGQALRTPSNNKFILYKESTSSVQIDLSSAAGSVTAIAIRTDADYNERSINLATIEQTWSAPATGDWVVYVTVQEISDGGGTGDGGGGDGSGGGQDDTVQTQNIALQSGWNLIGSAILPEEDAMTDVFSQLREKILIVKDEEGGVYSPEFGINTIGSWDPTDAYQVYAREDAEIHISGVALTSGELPIPLKEGWNLVPFVISGRSMSITTAFSSIKNELVLVEDQQGNTYDAGTGVDDIGKMLPGRGYVVYVKEAATLVYP